MSVQRPFEIDLFQTCSNYWFGVDVRYGDSNAPPSYYFFLSYAGTVWHVGALSYPMTKV